MSATRVLQVMGCLDRGGAENMVMSMLRNIDRDKIQFDFVLHLSRKGDFDDEAKSLGAKLYYAPRYNGKNHFEYKKWWNDFFKAHPEYKLLHSHIRSTASIYTAIAKKYGVKTIVHSHSTMTAGSGLEAFVKNLMQRDVTKNADLCLACSAEAGNWLFKNHEYTLFPNAIEAERFAFNSESRQKIRDKYNLGDSFVIGHAGRYHKIKNQTFLMDIFAEILKKKPDSYLVLVGEKIGSEGMEKSELIDYAEKKSITDRVVFTGNVPNVNEHMSAFDVFVFPSLYEGMPLTLVEAQAADLHCFVSDTVSHDCELTDNVEFVSLKSSAEEWADKILSCDYPQRKSRYDEIYNAGYDVRAGVEKLTDIYFSLLK